ncbi:MAG: 1-(5-phosphoribosyl)-5-[(5-phosphoribosylamino)methylideneamino]imidazole-4-carboxamide isomerase [Candidatus Melainabacteria bacterium]|nr:1-(5-phosphoribosyl)-5-[(5-phosphoribosylamino)methylideneamino]imidazole-4-carboxamide isomerase [Candidatus Melainabacteria bacterium]
MKNKNTNFEIIPAIDILDGKCVRLTQGQYNLVEEFSNNPKEIAKKWISLGATRLHIVDLNGAKEGYPVNYKTITKILKAAQETNKEIKIQVGGGIRTHESIRNYLNEGVSYLILGTKVLQDKVFLKEVTKSYLEKIIISLDMKNNKIAISGWQETTDTSLSSLASDIKDIKQIIYTDISKDGTLRGPNLVSLKEIASLLNSNIIVSGGISTIKDIQTILDIKALEHQNISGVILGKSLYKGTINLNEAIELAKKNSKQ